MPCRFFHASRALV
jgi:exonuclease VII large subunit